MGNQEHVHKLGYRTNQDIQKSNLNLERLTGHPSYIINELGEAGWLDFVGTLHIEEGSSAQYCAVFTSSAVFLALAAFNYWASYKLFTRMQVICNKWINI